MDYYKRTADILLKDNLDAFGAVLIEGPKWCGKTTTAQQQCNSLIKLQVPDNREMNQLTATTKPSLFLLGETPRLIDEWQEFPVVWDAVRSMVDERGMPGQFILTGSNSVDDSSIMHTGTGRIETMEMYPMSLYESKESTGEISLKALFDGCDDGYIDGKVSNMELEDLIFAACRGGWPASLYGRTPKAQLKVAGSYVKSVCKTDISKVDGVRRDEKLARKILKSYSRNISTLAKKTAVIEDVKSTTGSLAENTFDDYVGALERLFVIKDIEGWCPAIRSATAMRSGPKREFVDPSIAVAAMGLTPEALLMDLKTFGFIFETMCIRDLRAYSQALEGEVSYYHDRYGLEADIVLHLGDGRYALIECKLGSREIEEGAQHLLDLESLIRKHNETEKQVPLREPDLLIVLTGGRMAYTRQDGVKIIPLACLKP